MRALTTAAQAAVNARNVELVVTVVIDPTGLNYDASADLVQPYGFSHDIESAASGQIILLNDTEGSGQKRYSPESSGSCPIRQGMRVVIKESVASDQYSVFSGVVRQAVPSTDGDKDVITVTLVDPLSLLNYSDAVQNYVHASTAVSMERLDPDATDDGEHFYATIKTIVSTTKIEYQSATGESFLSAEAKGELNYCYNFTRRSFRRITGFDAGANTLDLTTTADAWQAGDVISNKIYHSIFNCDHTQLKQNSMKLVIRPLISGNADEPQYGGYGVDVVAGQVTMDSAVKTTDWAVYGSYRYFASGYDVEDLIMAIATAVDQYGLYCFVSADTIDTYQDAEGSGQKDQLTGAGSTWYCRYDNIITALAAGDFTIVGGGSFVSIDLKTGIVTTIGTVSSIRCDTNYSFYTVQATGIQIGEFWNTDLTSRSRYDAIKELLKAVAPNYRVFTDGRGKLWGQYFEQKAVADATCTLDAGNVESLAFFQDEDSYTRVKMWAKNAAPTNALTEAAFCLTSLYKKSAADVELNFVGYQNGRAVYVIPGSYGMIASVPYPVLRINGGVANFDVKAYVFYESGGQNNFNIVYGHAGDSFVAYFELPGISGFDLVPNTIRFSSGPADITSKILFSFSEGRIYVQSSAIFLEDVYSIALSVWAPGDNQGSGTDYVVDFQLGRVYINAEDVDPAASRVSLDFQYFLVGYPDNPVYSFFRMPDQFRWMIDGASESSAVWSWEEDPETDFSESPDGAVLFVATWRAARSIQGVRIAAGAFDTQDYSALNVKKTLPCNFRLSVLYCADPVFSAALDDPDSEGELSYLSDTAVTIYCKNAVNISQLAASGEIWIDFEQVHYASYTDQGKGDVRFNSCTRGYGGTTAVNHGIFMTTDSVRSVRQDATFNEICKELTNVSLSSGGSLDVDSAAFGTDFQAGSIMVVVESADPIKFTNRRVLIVGGNEEEAEVTVYPVSIQDFRVESNRILMSDITLAASDSTTTVEDTLAIRTEVGERLYRKNLSNNSTVLTQQQLDTLAKATLQELYKNHARAELTEMVNPSWRVGMTLRIQNTADGIDRNYLVEKLQNSGGKLTLSMSYYQ